SPLSISPLFPYTRSSDLLIWDLMIATCVLELFRWFARAIGLRRRGCRRCVAETDTRVGSLWASAFALCGHAEPTANPTGKRRRRSEEHTSELQSRENLVC